jgi:hypothetical protein
MNHCMLLCLLVLHSAPLHVTCESVVAWAPVTVAKVPAAWRRCAVALSKPLLRSTSSSLHSYVTKDPSHAHMHIGRLHMQATFIIVNACQAWHERRGHTPLVRWHEVIRTHLACLIACCGRHTVSAVLACNAGSAHVACVVVSPTRVHTPLFLHYFAMLEEPNAQTPEAFFDLG